PASAEAWLAVFEEHDDIFIFDHLSDIMLPASYLNNAQLKVWHYLMRLTRKFGRATFRYAHSWLHKELDCAESSLRAHLRCLELAGFLEIKTNYKMVGKEHLLRPTVPETVLVALHEVLSKYQKKPTQAASASHQPNPKASPNPKPAS